MLSLVLTRCWSSETMILLPHVMFFSSGVSSACSASKNSTRSQKQNVFTSSTSTALVATLQICRFSAHLGHQWMIIKCSIHSGDLQGAERGVVGPEQQCHCEQVSAFLPRVQRNHRCCIRVNAMHTLNWFFRWISLQLGRSPLSSSPTRKWRGITCV